MAIRGSLAFVFAFGFIAASSAQFMSGGGLGGGGASAQVSLPGNAGDLMAKATTSTFTAIPPPIPTSYLPFTIDGVTGTNDVLKATCGSFVVGQALTVDGSGCIVNSGVTPGSLAPGGAGTELQYRNAGAFGAVTGSAVNTTLGAVKWQVNAGATVTGITCDASIEGMTTFVGGLVALDGGPVTTGGNLSAWVACRKTAAATYGWRILQNDTSIATTITLNPGLASNPAACNTGAQTITNGSTLSLQLCVTPSAVDVTAGATDTSKLYVFTVDAKRLTLPAAGTANRKYQAGGNGTASYLVQAPSGTIYGCGTTVTAGTDLYVPANQDVQLVDDGTNYKCVLSGTKARTIDLTLRGGQTAGNVPVSHILQNETIIDIRCTPTVVAGGVATIAVWKTTSGTALPSGTKLNTTDCNANTGATTVQNMAVAVSSLVNGNLLGLVLTGAGWTAAGAGTVLVSVTVR